MIERVDSTGVWRPDPNTCPHCGWFHPVQTMVKDTCPHCGWFHPVQTMVKDHIRKTHPQEEGTR